MAVGPLEVSLTILAATSIGSSLAVLYFALTDQLLSRLRGLRQVSFLAVFDVASTLQFLVVTTSLPETSSAFCWLEAIQTQFTFIMWIGLHTTLSFMVLSNTRSEHSSVRSFMNEWMALIGVGAIALLTVLWMLLPCAPAVTSLSYAAHLCWMRADSEYSCRLLLFDIPLMFALCSNGYVLFAAIGIKASKQLPWARTLRSYTISYSLIFILVFLPYAASVWYSLISQSSGERLPSWLDVLVLVAWASHGTLNSAVFLPMWYGVSRTKVLLGGYSTLPHALEISHLRRLQEWERLVQSLTGLMTLRGSGTYSSPHRGLFHQFRAYSDLLLRPEEASALQAPSAASRQHSPSLDGPPTDDFASMDGPENLFPSLARSEAVARAQYRALFSYEQLSVSGAESVPLLGPHLLVHQGLLTLVTRKSTPSAADVYTTVTALSSSPLLSSSLLFSSVGPPTSPSVARKADEYMFRLVGDTLYYYLPGEIIRNEDFAGAIPLSSAVILPSWEDDEPDETGEPLTIRILTDDTVYELVPADAADAQLWLHKMTQLDPSGIRHVEVISEGGTPMLNLGGPTSSVCIARYPLPASHAASWCRSPSETAFITAYLDYMNLALAANSAVASRLAAAPSMYPLAFSPATFLTEIIGLHTVNAIGYVVQESVSQQVEAMLAEHELTGFMEEFVVHPVHGWGVDGYGARNYVSLSRSDLDTLRKDASFLAEHGGTGYSLQVVAVFVSGWMRLGIETRAAVAAQFARLRALPQSFDIGKFVFLRIIDFVPGASRFAPRSALVRCCFPEPSDPESYQEVFMNKVAVEVQSPESRLANNLAAASSSSFYMASPDTVSAARTPDTSIQGASPGRTGSFSSTGSSFVAARETTPLLAGDDRSSHIVSTLAMLSGVAQPRTVVDFMARPGSTVTSPETSFESASGPRPPSNPYEEIWLARASTSMLGNTSLHASVPTLGPPDSSAMAPSPGRDPRPGRDHWASSPGRVALCIGWCAVLMVCAGALYAFPLYVADVRARFGVHGTSHALVLAALYIIGFYFALPTGYMYVWAGIRATLLVASAANAVGYFVIYLGLIGAVNLRSPWALGACFALVGVGANGVAIGALAVGLNMLPLFAALASGVLFACASLGAVIVGAAFTHVFDGSLDSFFLASSVMGAVMVVGSVLLVPTRWEEAFARSSQRRLQAILTYSKSSPWLVSELIDGTSRQVHGDASGESGMPTNPLNPDAAVLEDHQASTLIAAALDHMAHAVTGLSLLVHPEFLTLAVVVSLVQGTSELVVSFIVNLEDDASRSQVFVRFMIIFTGRALGSFVMGSACTLFTPRSTPVRYSKPYTYWLVGGCLLVSMSHILLTRNDESLIEFGLLAAGLLYGALDVTFLLLLQKFFGAANIALNYAALTSIQSIGSLLLQIYAQKEVQSTCFGARCFTNLFLIASTCCFLGAGFGLLLWRMRARDRLRRTKVTRTVAGAAAAARLMSPADIN